MDKRSQTKIKGLRCFLCLILSFIIFIWIVNANDEEIIAIQNLSKSEISLSELSTINISLIGSEEELCIKPIDVVLAIDSTGSMAYSDPSNMRKALVKDFIKKMDFSNDRVAVVRWNTEAIVSPLSNNSKEILSETEKIDAKGGTDIDVGLASSIGLLANSQAIKSIIFLTDGMGNYTPSGVIGSQADLARTKGIMIFTIGLGPAVDNAYLTDIAKTTGGEYYNIHDANYLSDVFLDIYRRIGTDIVAEDCVVTYFLPSNLTIIESHPIPISTNKLQNGSTILIWRIGSVKKNQIRMISFDITARDPGNFTLGIPPDVGAINLTLGIPPDTEARYVNCSAIPKSVKIPPATLKVKLLEPYWGEHNDVIMNSPGLVGWDAIAGLIIISYLTKRIRRN